MKPTHQNETSISTSGPSYRAAPDFLGCDLGGETVLLSLSNGRYYGLNEVGTRIWELLRVEMTARELEWRMLSEFDIDAATCRDEVANFLALMTAEGLIEIVDEPREKVFEAVAGREAAFD